MVFFCLGNRTIGAYCTVKLPILSKNLLVMNSSGSDRLKSTFFSTKHWSNDVVFIVFACKRIALETYGILYFHRSIVIYIITFSSPFVLQLRHWLGNAFTDIIKIYKLLKLCCMYLCVLSSNENKSVICRCWKMPILYEIYGRKYEDDIRLFFLFI